MGRPKKQIVETANVANVEQLPIETPATTALVNQMDTDADLLPRPERRTLIPDESTLRVLRAIAEDMAKVPGRPGQPNSRESNFLILLAGWEHGLGALAAKTELTYISGQLGLSARCQVALVEQRGLGTIRTRENNIHEASLDVWRADWPKHQVAIVSYTAQDAQRAGLLTVDAKGNWTSSKDNWRKFPKDMLLARARSQAVRAYFPEVTLGLPYSQEELRDSADVGPVIDVHIIKPTEPLSPIPQMPMPAAEHVVTESASPLPAAAPEVKPARRPEQPEPDPALSWWENEMQIQEWMIYHPQPDSAVLEDCRRLLSALGWSPEEYAASIRMYGLESLRNAEAKFVAEYHAFLAECVLLRGMAESLEIPPVKLTAAVAQQGATHIGQLLPAKLRELTLAVAAKLPAEQRLNIGFMLAPAFETSIMSEAAKNTCPFDVTTTAAPTPHSAAV